jgi:uncharacterized protein (DUF983 family)
MREKNILGKRMTLKTEVTNGDCPMCHEHTVFVSIFNNIYRCISCGADTEQKVNGVISYMPITTSGMGPVPEIKLMDTDGPPKA